MPSKKRKSAGQVLPITVLRSSPKTVISNNDMGFRRFWLHFHSQLQRSCMLCESTFGRVDPGRRTSWQTAFPGRRVILPSKASDPARRVALLVPAEPSLCFA